MDNLGIISMLLFTFCFIPQVIKILKTKDVAGISLWLWLMVVAGYITGILYVVSLGNTILIATYSIGLAFALLTTGLVVFYRESK